MYDFSTLNSFEFEKLACDLLNSNLKKNQHRFQIFKEGKDKGIDLYSDSFINGKIIVQVKHYIKTPLSKLKYNLKKEELPKVILLNPDSYFIVTSTELSFQDKKDIKDIFSPYIKSTSNIYGRDDLNAILRINKDIEEAHYKLWFSSVSALKNILNYKFEGRRKQFTLEVLKRKFRLFVPTHSFYHSMDILVRNKYIILTGDPGIGKTITSDMLIYDFLRKDFHVTIIYDNIKEIEESLKYDNSKQIFYFDDFLGHTQSEILKSKSAENYLIKIINLIEGSENKFLILNTRKFILSSFIDESERLKNINLLKGESKIELTSYSYGVKRRILDLHISESNLNKENKDVISKLAIFICRSNNFSPRIIEFFTNDLVKNFDEIEYKKFIIENLAKPKKIWEHAYLNQISDYDRFLLNTLYSLGNIANKKELEKFYNLRLNFEVKNNNFKKPIDSYNKSIRVLKDGFLSINNYENKIDISYINPSLEDFLNYFISENEIEKERILSSSMKIEQWFRVFYKYSKSELIGEKYSKIFLLKYKEYLNDDQSIFLCAIFIFYFIDKGNLRINELLKSIKNWRFISERNAYIFIHLNNFMKDAISYDSLNETISELDNSFFFNYINDFELLEDIVDRTQLLKSHYNFYFKEFIKRNIGIPEYKNQIKKFLENLFSLFEEDVNEEIKFLNRIKDKQSYDDSEYYITKNHSFIIENINQNFEYDLSVIFDKNWDDIIKYNIVENVKDYEKNYQKELFDEDDFDNMIENTYSYEEYDSFELDLISYYEEKKELPKPLNTYLEELELNKPDLNSFTNFNNNNKDELPF